MIPSPIPDRKRRGDLPTQPQVLRLGKILVATSFQYIFSILLLYKYGTLNPLCPQIFKQCYCQTGLDVGILGLKEGGISEMRLKVR